MSKDRQFPPAHGVGNAAGANAGDTELLKECLAAIVDCLDQIKLLVAANNNITILTEIETQLDAICDKLLENQTILGETLVELQALCDKLLAIGDQFADLIAEIQALCEKLNILASAVCPSPQCAANGIAAVTYVNADLETEMTISVGGAGDVKIDAAQGDGSEAEITQYITDCLAAGNDVAWMATGVDGESASGTFLAAAQTNAFPNFYNQSVDASPSGAFKVRSMTATCLAASDGNSLKTYDKCAHDTLVDMLGKLCILTDAETPDITECCLPVDPQNRNRWCSRFAGTFPVGDGDPTVTYSVGVGGVYETLPNPYTEQDYIDALTTVAPNGEWAFVDNDAGETFLCRYDQYGPVTSRSSCCADRRCYLAAATSVQQFTAADEPVCTNALSVEGCYDQLIANNLATANSTLNEILQKQCDGQYPCLLCSSIDVAETAVVAAYDEAGLEVPFDQPVTGGFALAQALEDAGFIIDLAAATFVTVCGPKLVTAIRLTDGTIVNAVPGESKNGTLVCDPGSLAAVNAGFQNLCAKQEQTNSLLEQLLCCFKRPIEQCPLLTNGATGSNYNYIGGPTIGDTVVFPAGHETNGGYNGTTDFSTTLSADQATFEECYGTECTTVKIRLEAEHKSYGVSHSGFYWSLAGGVSTAVSPTTTMPYTSGGPSAPMGPTAGQPDETEFVKRWIEWELPKTALFAGTELRTSAFEAFNGSDGAGEDIQNITITVLGVS